MGYSAADESFTHQWPRPFDEVHHPDGSWSDRCYFFAHSPDGSLLLTNGYGNNPNQRSGLGYCKVALADGPMHWTCIAPLRRWRLRLEPNASGIEWDLYYEPRAPMWELLPMNISVGGRLIIDMYHIKEPGKWSGWVGIEGEKISVAGFHGGRDRTFGIRVADKIDFWLWLDAGFEDRAIEAWVIEAHDGSVQCVDGGITYVDGTLSKRFVEMKHDVEFDGNRKRPARAVLTFTDEEGETYRVNADSPHQDVNVYYGQPLPGAGFEKLDEGAFFLHFPWDSTDHDQLRQIEAGSMSIDQLMNFDLDGKPGHGIFEILSGGKGYQRYSNWPPMDMSKFKQPAASAAEG